MYVLLIASLLGLVVTYDYGKCNSICGIFQLLLCTCTTEVTPVISLYMEESWVGNPLLKYDTSPGTHVIVQPISIRFSVRICLAFSTKKHLICVWYNYGRVGIIMVELV